MELRTTTAKSPVGLLTIAVDDRGRLVRIDFPGSRAETEHDTDSKPNRAACAHVVKQLTEYFKGDRLDFELELAPVGTEFQLRAWRALQSIPFGRTVSYQEQAVRLGNPKAMRAVGAANGRNPIPIVVPCHRVIGKNGSLTGFGGGLPAKEFLLAHERKILAARKPAVAATR
jgi:methylated-DNA-[protein]-cysteine S-methyltransferase